MTGRRRIAIVLNHAHRLDDARHCAAILSSPDTTVAFYCLCGGHCSPYHWNLKPFLEMRETCYTDNHDLAGRYELECLSATTLIQHLKTADWVIPF